VCKSERQYTRSTESSAANDGVGKGVGVGAEANDRDVDGDEESDEAEVVRRSAADRKGCFQVRTRSSSAGGAEVGLARGEGFVPMTKAWEWDDRRSPPNPIEKRFRGIVCTAQEVELESEKTWRRDSLDV